MTHDKLGDELIGALEEALAYQQGTVSDARVDRVPYTARLAAVDPPPVYDAEQIRLLRKRLNVSQPIFAGMLNVSGSTVRAWEQGQRQPDGPSLRLLQIADHHPDALLGHVASQGRQARAGG
jgi:putative transcriptional regulator